MEKNKRLKPYSQAYFQQKSKLYQKEGYMQAIPLGRSFSQYQSHLYAFLIDCNVCLLPVYIWVIEFLLILSGLIPPNFFDTLFYVMYALLFVTSVIGLGAFTARTHGQSFGYAVVNYKLVRKDLKEANALQLIFRQALGFGLPVMIFGFLFETWGILVWLALNAACVLITPHQQTIFDLVFSLVSVELPDVEEMQEAIAANLAKKEEVKERVANENKAISKIDLHIRSSYSDDGFYDVEEIFKQAKNAGLEVISITDHNCARQNAAAKRFASLYGIQYIPGVEFDCQYKGVRLRVLGYYIDWNNEIFDVLERSSLKREKDISMERVKKFQELTGINIDVDSLISNSRFQTITAKDITRMVFNNERTRSMPFVQNYLNSANSEKDAMRSFEREIFGRKGPCYVKGDYPNIKTIIDAIHQAGGMAILASWHLKNLRPDMLLELAGLGVDGIECFSPELDERTMATLLRIAKDAQLFVSAGSDYHGPNKPDRYLGVTYLPEKAEGLVRIFTKAADQ
jgi:hypothetical protein